MCTKEHNYLIHWARSYLWSYQQVVDRVNSRVQKCNKKIASEAFCAVAKLITTVKTKEDMLKCFDVLQGASPISTLKYFKLSISDEHITVVEAECNWAGAKTWVQWWTRKKTSPDVN